MENLISSVNEHLKDCKWCKGHKLVLKKDRRIGLAQNYKLSCASCEKEDLGLRQKIFYLRRVSDGVGCYQKRRKLMLEINRNVRKLKKRRTERAGRYITSPLKKNLERKGQRRTLDYAVNMRAIISSFISVPEAWISDCTVLVLDLRLVRAGKRHSHGTLPRFIRPS